MSAHGGLCSFTIAIRNCTTDCFVVLVRTLHQRWTHASKLHAVRLQKQLINETNQKRTGTRTHDQGMPFLIEIMVALRIVVAQSCFHLPKQGFDRSSISGLGNVLGGHAGRHTL